MGPHRLFRLVAIVGYLSLPCVFETSGWEQRSVIQQQTFTYSVRRTESSQIPRKAKRSSYQRSKDWTWRDASGRVRTRAELEEILRQHKEWLYSAGQSGKRADLSGARLNRVDLAGAELDEACLSSAYFDDADLRGAGLTHADLYRAGLRRANLTKAVLRQSNLIGAKLNEARLTGAWLEMAKLMGTDFYLADLAGADLEDADLRQAFMVKVDLRGAMLSGANIDESDLSFSNLAGAKLGPSISRQEERILSKPRPRIRSWAHIVKDRESRKRPAATLVNARLSYVDLTGADLTEVKLNHSDLTEADLTDAPVNGADLSGSNFEPKTNPNFGSMAVVNGLESLTYETNPGALFQLRRQFQEHGFREQERKLTYALMRVDAQHQREACTLQTVFHNCGSYVFNTVFFDWTCLYGMHPGRPLLVILGLWALLTLVYWAFMHLRGPSGIYLQAKRMRRGKEYTLQFQIQSPSLRKTTYWKIPFFLVRSEWRLIRAAMFFSLMSAFNIGYQELNVGQWLRLLTKREYELKAVGWTRTFSGVQSLIGVYMIALWVLTYFGRPFE